MAAHRCPDPRATGGSYQLTPADAGKDVSVVVLAKKNGYVDGSATAPVGGGGQADVDDDLHDVHDHASSKKKIV